MTITQAHASLTVQEQRNPIVGHLHLVWILRAQELSKHLLNVGKGTPLLELAEPLLGRGHQAFIHRTVALPPARPVTLV